MTLPFPIPPGSISERGLELHSPSLKGLDVIALQIGLNDWAHRSARADFRLEPDGVLYKKTAAAIVTYQRAHSSGPNGLKVDGRAGQKTQLSLVVSCAGGPERAAGLPDHILKGLVANESLGWLGAVNDRTRGGKDLSAFQRRVYAADLSNWTVVRDAYNMPKQAGIVAQKFRSIFNALPPVKESILAFGVHSGNRGRWELTILSHNYPAGVAHLAAGHTVWRFIEEDEVRWSDDIAVTMSNGRRGVSRLTTRPARWVALASGGRLETVPQWCASYIAKATRYVDWSA